MRLDSYKHLDADTSLTVTLSMTQIANDCVALNYGAHRLLSAMVHALRERENAYQQAHPEAQGETSELADGIEALLNKGYYK